MLPEIAHYSLMLVLVVALIQCIVPLLGVVKHNKPWMLLASPLSYTQFIFTLLAFLLLVFAFVANDFSVLYVAKNSNTGLPLFYRLTAIWGAHEGSLLLWVLILSLWMVLVARFSRNIPLEMHARVLAVMSMVNVGFLLFILLTSNPFLRLLPAPLEGHDLNPLLQDPGFIIHPPMLYLGYVGFSVVFAFAIAALLEKRIDANWVKWVRPWTLIAWSFLSLGILLGSWWAYRVLGWGGWWFWDPVENASFMPWLLATALIHTLIVTEKRGSFVGWSILLAIFVFALSLLGLFLVRSGILISVHAFATDPERGLFILLFLGITIGGSLLLYAFRVASIHQKSHFQLISRESFLLMNNVLLTVATITVLLGTLYPLVLQVFDLGKISVGPPYFNSVFIPLFLLLMLFMGAGPHSYWQTTAKRRFVLKLSGVAVFCLIIAAVFMVVRFNNTHIVVGVSIAIAVWVIANAILDTVLKAKKLPCLPLSQYGLLLGHVGVAILVVGITVSSAYNQQRTVAMKIGDSIDIASYTVEFLQLSSIESSNYRGAQADVKLSKNNGSVRLNTQKRLYPARDMVTTRVGLHITPFRDIYVALGELMPDQESWSFRIYYKPFIRWIWAGGLIMLLGGLVSACDKRYRK